MLNVLQNITHSLGVIQFGTQIADLRHRQTGNRGTLTIQKSPDPGKQQRDPAKPLKIRQIVVTYRLHVQNARDLPADPCDAVDIHRVLVAHVMTQGQHVQHGVGSRPQRHGAPEHILH